MRLECLIPQPVLERQSHLELLVLQKYLHHLMHLADLQGPEYLGHHSHLMLRLFLGGPPTLLGQLHLRSQSCQLLLTHL